MVRKILVGCIFILALFIAYMYTNNTLFWGFGIEGYPIEKAQLKTLSDESKLKPQLISFYIQWPDSGNKTGELKSSLDAIWSIGAVPSITWEPMYFKDSQKKTIPVEDILKGNFDEYIKAFAEEIKLFVNPVIIRFAHEMNLSEYHWGTEEKNYGSSSPAAYIKMFRYVVEAFRANKVKNVLWAFCPNCDSIPNEPWNVASAYYPGDAYVDLLGMDGYNWEKPHRSFEETFSRLYYELKKINDSLPIIVFETATPKHTPDRKKWIEDAVLSAKQWKLRGIIWFQVNKENDWRINAEEVALIHEHSEVSSQNWAARRLRH